MTRIVVFDHDTPLLDTEIPDQRFIFIKTKSGKIYHIDCTDEVMWQANEEGLNLGEGHRQYMLADRVKT